MKILALLSFLTLSGCSTNQYVELETRHKKEHKWDAERVRFGYGQKYKSSHGTHKLGARINAFPHADHGDRYDEAEMKYSFEW